MSINELKNAIQHLSHEDMVELIRWMAEYDNGLWDRQIEDDLKTGKLDKLIQTVRQDIKAGKVKAI